MEKNKSGKYFKYAVGEIALVVIGILIALQINNWNERRKERLQEQGILKGLKYDLSLDVNRFTDVLEIRKEDMESFTNCLEILTTENQATKAEFMKNFEWILDVGGVSLHKTTFNNLQTSGQINFIKNKDIKDSIVNYYDSRLEIGESAIKDYVRNVIAPYLLQFDYIPNYKASRIERNERVAQLTNPDSYSMPGKPLEAYKRDYFIINALRQKIYMLEHMNNRYETAIKRAKGLDSTIQTYLDDD